MKLTTNNWLMFQRRITAVPHPDRTGDDAIDVKSALFPSDVPYYSPLNPIFLYKTLTLKALRDEKHWLARDGTLPLRRFFSQNPSPRPLRGTLYVHRSASALVPPAWLNQVKAYEIVSRRLHSARVPATPGSPRRLLICGIVGAGFRPIHPSRQIVAQLERTLAKHAVRASEVACLFHKQSPDWIDEIRRICRQHPKPVRLYAEEELHCGNGPLDEWDVLELNERELVADSFVIHRALQRGATLLSARRRPGSPPETHFYPLSLYHGISVTNLSDATRTGSRR